MVDLGWTFQTKVDLCQLGHAGQPRPFNYFLLIQYWGISIDQHNVTARICIYRPFTLAGDKAMFYEVVDLEPTFMEPSAPHENICLSRLMLIWVTPEPMFRKIVFFACSPGKECSSPGVDRPHTCRDSQNKPML